MPNMILYRGDAEKIRRFEFAKTHKAGLVGQGIYLTNNIDIAETYRGKDSSGFFRNSSDYIVSGLFKNKNEAKNTAFLQFLKMEWAKEGKGKFPYLDDKRVRLFRASKLDVWENLFERKVIIFDISPNYINMGELRVVDPVYKYIRLEYSPKFFNIGRITEFSFPNDNRAFENAVLNVDRGITEPLIWENFFEHQLFHNKDTPKLTREEYLQKFTGMRLFDLVKTFRFTFNDFHRPLKELGFIGYEYQGGIRIGSYKHRAFCLWDEDFVNSCKVKAFR